MFTLAIIPARMASTRFYGKPLHPLLGMPMIGHVALRTAQCTGLDAVYVATCDAEIAQYCQTIGVNVVMTHKNHVRCTERCAEALPIIEAREGRKADVVVIVQGDEPLVHPQMIHAALEPMRHDTAVQVVNLMAPLTRCEEFVHPNTIKVVTDGQGRALYFSRHPLPYRQGAQMSQDAFLTGTSERTLGEVSGRASGGVCTEALETLSSEGTVGSVTTGKVFGHKQVCIMPFRREALCSFVALRETPLERAESIDMLRLLEHGSLVHMVPTHFVNQSVDCLADVPLAEELLRQDALFLDAKGYTALS